MIIFICSCRANSAWRWTFFGRYIAIRTFHTFRCSSNVWKISYRTIWAGSLMIIRNTSFVTFFAWYRAFNIWISSFRTFFTLFPFFIWIISFRTIFAWCSMIIRLHSCRTIIARCCTRDIWISSWWTWSTFWSSFFRKSAFFTYCAFTWTFMWIISGTAFYAFFSFFIGIFSTGTSFAWRWTFFCVISSNACCTLCIIKISYCSCWTIKTITSIPRRWLSIGTSRARNWFTTIWIESSITR